MLIDVREADEFDQGAIDGSVHVPRGFLESRIGGIVPDLSTPIVITCQSGARSAFAARSLEELGYEDVASLSGGFGGWKQSGFPWSAPRVLNEAQRARYSRHTLIPEVGETGSSSCSTRRCCSSAPAASARRPGSTWPPPAWAPSGSSMPTWSTVEPPAPGPALDGVDRHAEDGVGQAAHRGAQSRRERGRVPRAPDVREHRPHARGRRRDRRRHRQLPDALPAERRQPAPPHPGRARLDLPLRGPADGVQARRRARATAASSRSRPRPSSRRRAPRPACSACCRGSWARCRRTRRSS